MILGERQFENFLDEIKEDSSKVATQALYVGPWFNHLYCMVPSALLGVIAEHCVWSSTFAWLHMNQNPKGEWMFWKQKYELQSLHKI